MPISRRHRAPVVRSVRLLPGGEVVRVTFDQTVFADDSAGWVCAVGPTPISVSSATIKGRVVDLNLASAADPAEALSATYTASGGTLRNSANRKVANLALDVTGVEYVAPTLTLTDSAGYPLADDGTVAAANAYQFTSATGPNYHLVTHTYDGGGDSMTAPAVAAIFGAQAITVGAGKKLGCQLGVTAIPTGDFDSINLVAIEIDAGAPTGNMWNIALGRTTTEKYQAKASSGTVPVDVGASTPGAPYVGGLVIDGDTGAVTYYCRNGGLMGSASLAFTPGRKIAFVLVCDDTGLTPNGQTAAYQIIPNATDMVAIGFPAGVTDWNDAACPAGT